MPEARPGATPPDRLLDLDEVASALSISKRNVQELIRSGNLTVVSPTVYLTGGGHRSRRVRLSEVQRFIAELPSIGPPPEA